MIPKLAWRNVWRNKIRSGVILAAITFGLWGGISAMGIMKGLNDQRVANFLNTQTSHIQVHDTAYVQEKEVSKTLDHSQKHLEVINQQSRISGASGRLVVNGMASSPVSTAGVTIKGINPDQETEVTTIHDNIVEGQYFKQADVRNPVIIGQALADQLSIDLDSKLILKFQTIAGEMTSGAFTVVGVFKTSNSSFDESTVFIDLADAQKLTGSKEAIHEIAVILKDRGKTDQMVAQLSELLPAAYKVRSWRDIRPGMAYVNDFSSQILYFVILIILLALAFGIINTMLMAVMERTRELGMLMAVGLNKTRVFTMIVLETIFLSLQGAILGMGIGWLTINYLSERGINLSQFSEGLASFGIGDKIYPVLDPSQYPTIAVLVLITALVSAIYPAIKALSLKPAEAIRAV